jgi:hypothetical protein
MMNNTSIEQFLDELASKSPTPGGLIGGHSHVERHGRGQQGGCYYDGFGFHTFPSASCFPRCVAVHHAIAHAFNTLSKNGMRL